mmetsp:Transcript_133417/g.259777  ORF Transcript_133417/g.259777 Transcript_133417/m.259777 type:complete len:84 (+) Transcript_133417:295-546(+)
MNIPNHVFLYLQNGSKFIAEHGSTSLPALKTEIDQLARLLHLRAFFVDRRQTCQNNPLPFEEYLEPAGRLDNLCSAQGNGWRL